MPNISHYFGYGKTGVFLDTSTSTILSIIDNAEVCACQTLLFDYHARYGQIMMLFGHKEHCEIFIK